MQSLLRPESVPCVAARTGRVLDTVAAWLGFLGRVREFVDAGTTRA